MAGDAEMQPADSVDSLSDLAGLMEGGEEGEELEESEQEAGQEESEGEEAEQEEGEEDEEQDEPKGDAKKKFTVKHDGKEIELELTPEEEVEMLQKSFDYSKKTMAVAEERKAVEAERSQAQETRQHHEKALTATLDRLNAFIQFTEATLGEPPSIDLAQQDVGLYIAQKEQHENRKGQLQKAHEAVSNVQQEAQRLRQARIAEQADATEKALRDTLSGWTDNTLSELADYLGKAGLSPQTATDAYVTKGLWELAHKAKAYDAILAKKAELKPASQLAKVQKPLASNQPNRKAQSRMDAFKRFQSKPSINSLADLTDS